MDWLKRWGKPESFYQTSGCDKKTAGITAPSFPLYYNGQTFFDFPPPLPKTSNKSIKYVLRKKKIYCLHIKCEAAFRIRKVTTFSFTTYLIICMDLEGIGAVRTVISRLQECAFNTPSSASIDCDLDRELNFFFSPLKYFPLILSMYSHDRDHFSLYGNAWLVHFDVCLNLGKRM